MKLDSKLFDSIRIKSRHSDAPRREIPRCAWEGCDLPGIYRAPKGNRAVGEYHSFCLEHVRHYNTAFNFFAGMSPDEMTSHLRHGTGTGTQTEGRPGRGHGARQAGPGPSFSRGRARENAPRFSDPLNIFARYNWQHARSAGSAERERARPLHEQDRRAFETLGFSGHAPSSDVKAAYKQLVKRHHPDANGGDKASEERLRAVIAAYKHLKLKGFAG